MVRKTIRIDLEAHERLRGAKRPNESFSQTIKRVVKPPVDFEKWTKRLRENPLSEEATRAVEEQIANRQRPSARER